MNRIGRLLAFGAFLLFRHDAIAQSDGDASQCFGFTFGTWKPALDLTAAGHDSTPPPSALIKAPGGREWASDQTPNDTTLFLFPSWWPVGIRVTFSRRPLSAADTVSGSAVAFVANGSLTPPRAPMRIWRVACR